jgi:predicted kinase
MNWQTLSAGDVEEVLAWAEPEPWARAMAACRQHAAWHAEGDVWTHTRMVCRQLPRLAEWPALAPRERTILLFTALFHDSAKPLTSQVDPDSGAIRSPKHALKGEHLARGVLRELGCDLATREEIARLVRFHGRPAFLLERDDPAREVISLSWLVENRLLYWFALADNRGRTTDSTSRPEDNLHLWKLTAEECDCFERPYPFANEQARFLFYRKPDADRFYVPHEDYRVTVTLMSGLPGAGKDTWLAANRPDVPIVALDEIREELDVAPTENQGVVAQQAKERCRELLRAKTSFAFSATNILRQTRARWIDLFADYGARIELVYVEPPLEAILEQNRRRNRNVPERVIRDLAAKLEPPTWTEGHSLTVVAQS